MPRSPSMSGKPPRGALGNHFLSASMSVSARATDPDVARDELHLDSRSTGSTGIHGQRLAAVDVVIGLILMPGGMGWRVRLLHGVIKEQPQLLQAMGCQGSALAPDAG